MDHVREEEEELVLQSGVVSVTTQPRRVGLVLTSKRFVEVGAGGRKQVLGVDLDALTGAESEGSKFTLQDAAGRSATLHAFEHPPSGGKRAAPVLSCAAAAAWTIQIRALLRRRSAAALGWASL